MVTWEGLDPPYGTICADPPWAYDEGWPMSNGQGQRGNKGRRPLDYSTIDAADLGAMPVADLAAPDAWLYLWTTNRYLEAAFIVARRWGFTPSQTLTWCKPPRGLGPGGTFANTTEFIVLARRGQPKRKERTDSTWWQWSRSGHSRKPQGFYDLVERVSPGPYVELFARQPRLGWSHWGHGYESAVV